MKYSFKLFFRKDKGIDIVKDEYFIQANKMLKVMCIESKKADKKSMMSAIKYDLLYHLFLLRKRQGKSLCCDKRDLQLGNRSRW